MEKNILLATDGSIDSERAVSYVGNLFAQDPEFKITLFHVMPPLPPILVDKDYGGEWQITSPKAAKLQEMHRQKADMILAKAKSILTKAGVRGEAVVTRITERKIGLARDIIHEAERGNYDAVVIGRRGLSKMQSAIMGSISTKVVEVVQNRPVWVIDGKITSRKVLVAMDACDSSLEAVDHVGFVFRGIPDVELLLYHVIPGLRLLGVEESEIDLKDVQKVLVQKDTEKIQSYFVRAKSMLTEEGIAGEQVAWKIKKGSTNIAKDIRDEALKRGMGTIVLSRRGISKTREFFMGSVSNKVLSISSNLAVWIV